MTLILLKLKKYAYQHIQLIHIISHHNHHNAAKVKRDSTWLPYLKDFLIQDSGAKDSYALCVDDSLVASSERPGHLLLTIHNDGDTLLLHADGYTVPSVQQGSKGCQKYNQISTP